MEDEDITTKRLGHWFRIIVIKKFKTVMICKIAGRRGSKFKARRIRILYEMESKLLSHKTGKHGIYFLRTQ